MKNLPSRTHLTLSFVQGRLAQQKSGAKSRAFGCCAIHGRDHSPRSRLAVQRAYSLAGAPLWQIQLSCIDAICFRTRRWLHCSKITPVWRKSYLPYDSDWKGCVVSISFLAFVQESLVVAIFCFWFWNWPYLAILMVSSLLTGPLILSGISWLVTRYMIDRWRGGAQYADQTVACVHTRYTFGYPCRAHKGWWFSSRKCRCGNFGSWWMFIYFKGKFLLFWFRIIDLIMPLCLS